jgi:RHS repeat-associated protein
MDAAGNVVETLDYYPYGGLRIDTKAPAYTGEKRKYAGTEYDATSGLNYMQARYQNPTRGQFISQDPVFWEVGQSDDGKKVLLNPQSQNSYSYANGNPIVYADPGGRLGINTITNLPIGIIQGIKSTGSFIGNIFTHPFITANSIADTANMFKQNPALITQGVVQSAKNFANASDADQGKIIGAIGIGLIGPKGFAGEGALAKIADDALVVRGGGLSNQTAERIATKMGPSRTSGVNGFSVQCNGTCADISQLSQYLPNFEISSLTAGSIRAAGGDVVSTPGIGYHATVTGLSAEQASRLPWKVQINPNPLRRKI